MSVWTGGRVEKGERRWGGGCSSDEVEDGGLERRAELAKEGVGEVCGGWEVGGRGWG